ncbi:MAG: hypothetical protein KDJ88_12420, partial [Bauldia sp.]|nr:hypothetical protein [Bauldia sp.]
MEVFTEDDCSAHATRPILTASPATSVSYGGVPVSIQPFPLALALSVALAAPAIAEPIRIVALGDSLTAGYGLAADEAFPARLEAALRARGHDVIVVNAGVSGDTASDGAARLDWSIGPDADAVIVELG